MEEDVKEGMLGFFICSWRGHRYQQKMKGWVCRRCRIWVLHRR